MPGSSKPPSARRAKDAKPSFVSFPPRSSERDLTLKSALLLALQGLGRVQAERAPLVSVSVTTPEDLLLTKTLSKRYGKRAITLDMGNSPLLLQEALLGDRSHCLDKAILRKRTLHLDEAYLHQTLKPWESMTEPERMLLVATAMEGTRTLKFSVNFGDRRTVAGADPKVTLRKLRNELTRLADLGPVLVVFERDDDGREHLHGMVQTSTAIVEVKRLLRKLGGRSSNVRFANLHQVRVKDGLQSMGWCHYMLKDIVGLAPHEASKRIYVSRDAALLAREVLERVGAECRRHLWVTPERRGRMHVYRAVPPAGTLGAVMRAA